ncbi:MAG: hypothetical protein BMS9Abin01_0594 [Gammaproteobacteria bacterium]|nr:MAG: hypothetical protein BMS9Abin01_0594 [Gammaproteobacteria bacterium]
MTEEPLRSMTEQQIRARFRCAPAYYLQAKLEKKRVLERLAKQGAPDAESHWQAALAEQSQRQAAHSEPEGPEVALREPESLDVALPGFEILDAALAECDDPDTMPAQHTTPDPGATPDRGADPDPEHTQQTILEAALEDYSNWPLLPGAESAAELVPAPEPEIELDLERKLELVLESEPELRVVLESEPDLTVVLESEPDLTVVLESEPEFRLVPESQPEIAPRPVPDNVTRADFGHRAARTVRVVSVVMDRKRPNMVRVVGETTRRAS